jgi:hypothetical protein
MLSGRWSKIFRADTGAGNNNIKNQNAKTLRLPRWARNDFMKARAS